MKVKVNFFMYFFKEFHFSFFELHFSRSFCLQSYIPVILEYLCIIFWNLYTGSQRTDPNFINCSLYADSIISYFWKMKVASRVQNIEVFEKGWNFSSCSCLASCVMKKKFFFLHGTKKQRFFLIFTMKYLLLRWAIWMRIQL